jgi:hypothetical protein
MGDPSVASFGLHAVVILGLWTAGNAAGRRLGPPQAADDRQDRLDIGNRRQAAVGMSRHG